MRKNAITDRLQLTMEVPLDLFQVSIILVPGKRKLEYSNFLILIFFLLSITFVPG